MSQVFVLLFVGTAVGCILWFVLFLDAHYFNRQVSQEARANDAVGANPLPKAKLEIIIRNKRDSCRVVDKVKLDGSNLWVYWHKVCTDNYGIQADHISWKGYAPDGTVVTSGRDEAAELEPGEKGEFHTERFDTDPRVVKVVIEANWNDVW